jgi:hypothetical protein
MKINKDNIEQWATWGGAVVCILLAVAVLLALGVGITRKAAQSAQPDPTLVAQRLAEILAGGTATPGAAPAGQEPQAIRAGTAHDDCHRLRADEAGDRRARSEIEWRCSNSWGYE